MTTKKVNFPHVLKEWYRLPVTIFSVYSFKLLLSISIETFQLCPEKLPLSFRKKKNLTLHLILRREQIQNISQDGDTKLFCRLNQAAIATEGIWDHLKFRLMAKMSFSLGLLHPHYMHFFRIHCLRSEERWNGREREDSNNTLRPFTSHTLHASKRSCSESIVHCHKDNGGVHIGKGSRRVRWIIHYAHPTCFTAPYTEVFGWAREEEGRGKKKENQPTRRICSLFQLRKTSRDK